MRLKDFEGKLLSLNIPSCVVRAERVFYLGDGVVSVWWLDGQGLRQRGEIYLPFGAGQNIKVVREELQNFIEEEG